MKNDNQLRTCPFCGSNARILKREIGIKGRACFDWWHAIQCARCNAAIGYDDNRFRDVNEAIKAWNNRIADFIEREALELAAIHWHNVLMGKHAVPWERTGTGWQDICRRQTRAAIEAYKKGESR